MWQETLPRLLVYKEMKLCNLEAAQKRRLQKLFAENPIQEVGEPKAESIDDLDTKLDQGSSQGVITYKIQVNPIIALKTLYSIFWEVGGLSK